MDKKLLQSVICTLEHIEVRGRENMNMLVGCINALESVVKSLNDEAKEGEN